MRGINFCEQITVDHLGDVEVRTLSYSTRRALFSKIRTADEESDAYQSEFMLQLLAECVRYKDNGEPCGTAEEWDLFAGRHTNEAMAVFKTACELNGFEPEVIEKN